MAAVKEMKDLSAQTKCPLSGNAIAEGQGYEYQGHFIGTCCGNCAKAVEKDPLSAIKQIRANGEQPALAEGFAKQSAHPPQRKHY